MRFPHRVTISKPGRKTDKYNPTLAVKDWTTATSIVTDGWWQPFVGEEDESGGNVQVFDGVMYLPAATDIDADDQVTVLGATWDVVGPPQVFTSGSPLDHVRARLRRVTG